MSIKKTDKIVLTGGTGFVGSHMLRDLISQGFTNVFALKRKDSKLDILSDIQEKITWIEGDILDIKSLEILMENSAGVIHAAAKVSYNPKDREDIMQVNVEGTANVVNVSLACNVSKLIFISSVAAIGRAKPGKLIDEHTEWHQDESTTNYGLSKHLAEMEVWRGMHEGLTVGILNPSMILGPSYWGDSSTKLFTHVSSGSRFYPAGSNGFVDVRDLAILTTTYLQSEIANERVIAVGGMMTYKELLTKIASGLELQAPTSRISGILSGILWRVFSFSKDPTITKETVRISSKDFAYENSKSKTLFNFTYRELSDTIQDTCTIYSFNLNEKEESGFFKTIRS